MAEPPPAPAAPAAPPPPQPMAPLPSAKGQPNPAFKALGLPNIRAKLPSRNWLIFIGLTTTWTALLICDRREKSRIKSEWCARVSHLAEQPLPPLALPRKITIYLSAPPGDGMGVAREYFKEYVKPVLVAAALDYDVVEGRKPGEVRVGVMEGIRKWRKAHGEKVERPAVEGEDGDVAVPVEEDLDKVENIRKRVGVVREVEDEEGGVLIVGRHTWKEFVHGVHQGWLGPLETPPPPPKPLLESTPDAPSTDSPPPSKPKQPQVPPPSIPTTAYHTAPLPPSFPHTSTSLPLCSPATIIPYPHLLGFFNTPYRIYRYLTQRHLMDRTCREAAALALGFHRPFSAFTPASLPTKDTTSPTNPDHIDPNLLDSLSGKTNSGDGGSGGEIDLGVYPEEEQDWHRKFRKVEDNTTPTGTAEETEEDTTDNEKLRTRRAAREWGEKIAVDGRIAGRLRRYDIAVVQPGSENWGMNVYGDEGTS